MKRTLLSITILFAFTGKSFSQPKQKWAFAYAQGFDKCFGQNLITNIVDISALPIDFEKHNVPYGTTDINRELQSYFRKEIEKQHPNCLGDLVVVWDCGISGCKKHTNSITSQYKPIYISKEEIINSRQKEIERLTTGLQQHLLNVEIGSNGLTDTQEQLFNSNKKKESESLHSADNLYEKGNYKEAATLYEKAANSNNTVAQYKLGGMYEAGKGVAQDYAKAIEWYQKSANLGNEDAQIDLAQKYTYGYAGIIAKDGTKAFEYYQKSADKGNPDAQNELGRIYYNRKDYEKAIKWYQKSANQGNAFAQWGLGEMLYYGEGSQKDYTKALEWCEKSVNNSSHSFIALPGHQYQLGVMYEGIQNTQAAKYWYKKAAAYTESIFGTSAKEALKRLGN